ncbi:DUF3147 family protein [Variovorax sp. PCZ-1]|uniref:DUF3147 family protein n=1 Tax=Variovorax sp. PCZ-1 TaxID=2835533 RepID=UPI001BCB8498|nr:DUF3147 family protein [Variovorax sp. PCZ-1]MBS7808590.1 DUF3147 family protein [Variovorax sp. PCZ-1]
MYLVLKFAISAALIVAISELAKRSLWLAALLAALPLTSLLAFAWMHHEGASLQSISQLSRDIFWLVLPSLALFLLLPFLIGKGWSFWSSLSASCAVTALLYGATAALLRFFSTSPNP